MGFVYSGKDIKLGLPAWTTRSGAKIAFGHCQHEQDKYNFQGKEFHYMGFDQVEEFTETQFLFLVAQNRTSNKDIRCYVRCTMNPGGVGHGWVKKRYIDCLKPLETKYFKRIEDEDTECSKDDEQGISRCFVPASVYDNPSIIDNDPMYVRRLEQLPEIDKQALLHGNWDVFAGQFFREWRKAIHVKEKEIIPEFQKFLSLDYGFAKPSSVGWWQVDRDGNVHRYREIYGEGREYDQLAKEVMAKTPEGEKIVYCVADPAIWGDKSHHKKGLKGESGAETLQKEWGDFTTLIKADNSRVTGWGRMRIMLKPIVTSNGVYSRFTVSPKCKDFIRTVPVMIHDDKKPEDMNSDGEDHCADEARYFVMSRPEPSEPEKAKPVKWTSDWFERQEKRQHEDEEDEDE